MASTSHTCDLQALALACRNLEATTAELVEFNRQIMAALAKPVSERRSALASVMGAPRGAQPSMMEIPLALPASSSAQPISGNLETATAELTEFNRQIRVALAKPFSERSSAMALVMSAPSSSTETQRAAVQPTSGPDPRPTLTELSDESRTAELTVRADDPSTWPKNPDEAPAFAKKIRFSPTLTSVQAIADWWFTFLGPRAGVYDLERYYGPQSPFGRERDCYRKGNQRMQGAISFYRHVVAKFPEPPPDCTDRAQIPGLASTIAELQRRIDEHFGSDSTSYWTQMQWLKARLSMEDPEHVARGHKRNQAGHIVALPASSSARPTTSDPISTLSAESRTTEVTVIPGDPSTWPTNKVPAFAKLTTFGGNLNTVQSIADWWFTFLGPRAGVYDLERYYGPRSFGKGRCYRCCIPALESVISERKHIVAKFPEPAPDCTDRAQIPGLASTIAELQRRIDEHFGSDATNYTKQVRWLNKQLSMEDSAPTARGRKRNQGGHIVALPTSSSARPTTSDPLPALSEECRTSQVTVIPGDPSTWPTNVDEAPAFAKEYSLSFTKHFKTVEEVAKWWFSSLGPMAGVYDLERYYGPKSPLGSMRSYRRSNKILCDFVSICKHTVAEFPEPPRDCTDRAHIPGLASKIAELQRRIDEHFGPGSPSPSQHLRWLAQHLKNVNAASCH